MIHYDILLRGLDYYQRDCDYEYIEVPWFVEPSTDAITRPMEAAPCLFKNKAFVGSAEQSFLQLAREGKLQFNRSYVSMTPCIRDDDYDDSHEMGFMKVELFRLCVSNTDSIQLQSDLTNFIDDSYNFFDKYANSNLEVEWYNKYSCDINNNGIEVGSYSVKRELLNDQYATWICGTGVAEPRFSYSLSQYKDKS